MPHSRPIVLITGFGPFPGQPQNASSVLARKLATLAKSRIPGYAFRAEILPTEWEAGPARLSQLLETLQPVIALHFGVSRRARGFVIETRARNARADAADACGVSPTDGCIVATGPETIRSTLPASEIAAHLRRMSLPVQISRDAGAYLCNAILYHSLEDGQAREKVRRSGAGLGPRRGFIHIPDRIGGEGPEPNPASGSRRPAAASLLDWEQTVAGGLAILSVCTGVAGGS